MAAAPKYAKQPFGIAFVELMKLRGMTYRQVAEASGLSAGYLNHIVKGNRPVPEDGQLDRIAKALGVPSDYFMEARIRAIVAQMDKEPQLVNRLYKQLA
jgi:transcriptional regulator with XRE-family HTH domain